MFLNPLICEKKEGEYVVFLKHWRPSNEDICFHMVLDT